MLDLPSYVQSLLETLRRKTVDKLRLRWNNYKSNNKTPMCGIMCGIMHAGAFP